MKIAETVRFYCQDRNHVQNLNLIYDSSEPPREADKQELINYHKAKVYCAKLEFDFWQLLYNLWDETWGEALKAWPALSAMRDEISEPELDGECIDFSVSFLLTPSFRKGKETYLWLEVDYDCALRQINLDASIWVGDSGARALTSEKSTNFTLVEKRDYNFNRSAFSINLFDKEEITSDEISALRKSAEAMLRHLQNDLGAVKAFVLKQI